MSVRQVVGIHAAREALKVRSSKELNHIYLKEGWGKHPDLVELSQLAQAKSLKLQEVSLKKLNKIHLHHQGVCVVVEGQPLFDEKKLKQKSIVLILDGLKDPKNFGAIIRTAWLMGVDGIFIPSRRSVSLTSSVIKSASGGVEHVPVEVHSHLISCLEHLKKIGFWIYALDGDATQNIWNEKFDDRVAFVLGSEEGGLRKSIQRACDQQISISQQAKFHEASYNVSVATALVLGECFKQHHPP